MKAVSFEVVDQDGSADGTRKGVWDKNGLDVELNDGLKANSLIVDHRKHINIPIDANSVSDIFFIAEARYVVEEVRERHRVASSSGTLQIEVTPSGTAPGSGTDQLTGTIDLSATANTNIAGTLIASPTVINPGDGVGIVIAGTMTSLAGGIVTVTLRRVA